MTRTTLAALALLTCLALPAPQASASDFSLLAGIGPRFDVRSGDVNAVSMIHFDYELISMLRMSAEVYGYVLGDAPDDIAFADTQVGLLFVPPIPGWFGVETGLNIGVSNLLSTRHGDGRIIGMLRPEVALTASVAIFKARLAYQHNMLPLGKVSDLTKVNPADEGQLTIQAGFEF